MSTRLEDYVPFASDVSAGTGLNFYTVLGWVQAEGGPAGNPVNLRPGTSYGDEHAAAQAVIKQLTAKNTNQPGIVTAARARYPSQDAEILAEAHAIAYSSWNDPNGKGSASREQYQHNIQAGAVQALYDGTKPGTVAVPGKPGDTPTYMTPQDQLFPGLEAALDSIASAFGWITNADNWKRVAIALLGGGLVLVGLKVALS